MSAKKKVVLLGDSIRLIGYGQYVQASLGDEYEVWQPEASGMYVSNVLREIFDYRDQIEQADIVHFNSGEWDICDLFGDGPFTPEEFYVSQTVRIAKLLQQAGKNVIFATTTPVKVRTQYNSNSVIERFNSLVVSELKKIGVVINDLFTVVNADQNVNICEDSLHLSEVGSRKCAESTAVAIRSIK